MDFITEDGYHIKQGMQEEYQRWVRENTEAIRKSLPDGIEYIGTYVTVYGNDYVGGTFRDFFRIDSYGALDRMAAEQRRPGSEMSRLNSEAGRFIDLSRGQDRWTRNLYKNIVDATIVDIQPSEEKEAVGAGT